MSNQASELFELCKEVYEKTGWDKADKFWHSLVSHDMKRWSDYKLQDYKPNDLFGMRIVPLYTSDYLLEKLPEHLEKYGGFGCSRGYSRGEAAWRFYFQKEYGNLVMADEQIEGIADTPLKALLKLTIALDDARQLKGEE